MGLETTFKQLKAAAQRSSDKPLSLMIAFEPMIRRIRGRLGKRHDEDLDQRVLTAFLNAVRALPADADPGVVPIALRRHLVRELIEEGSRDAAFRDLEELDHETYVSPAFQAGEGERKALSGDDVERLLARASIDPNMGEMLLATVGGDESVPAFVARTYPTLGAKEQSALARRLTEKRRQALYRLRANEAA